MTGSWEPPHVSKSRGLLTDTTKVQIGGHWLGGYMITFLTLGSIFSQKGQP